MRAELSSSRWRSSVSAVIRFRASPNRTPAATSVAVASPIATWLAWFKEPTKRMSSARLDAAAGTAKPEDRYSCAGTAGSGVSHTEAEMSSSETGQAIESRNQPMLPGSPNSAEMSPEALARPAAAMRYQRAR